MLPTHSTHDRYRHEALLWQGHDEFLAGTLPFILEGVHAGQPVLAAVVPERVELLQRALGPDADRVRFADMTELGANPARIIPAWRRFAEEHAAGGRPVRGIGEPICVRSTTRRARRVPAARGPAQPGGRAGERRCGCCARTTSRTSPRTWSPKPAAATRSWSRWSATAAAPCTAGRRHAGTIFEADLPPVDVAVSHRVLGRADLAVVARATSSPTVSAPGWGRSAVRSSRWRCTR